MKEAEKKKQTYPWQEFDRYLQQADPDKLTKATNWQTAMGLQAVDRLTPSAYLVETARRNVEGEIGLDEVEQLLHSYYERKDSRTGGDVATEEADRASANINRILSSRTIDFTANGYTTMHRRIFEGVFEFAGRMRDYDITKKEWVLRGDTVSYLHHQDLHRAVEYDLQQERDFKYRGLSMAQKVGRIARFAAGLWQIHPFPEGNTRTTAVFLIQYLRSMGFDVNNEMFAHHSWYFRNALVRANYKNIRLDIDYDYSFLEAFLRNLLMGEHNELRNRRMIINPPESLQAENDTDSAPNDTDNAPHDTDSRRQKILALVAADARITTRTLAASLHVSVATIKRDIATMKQNGRIERIGSEKGGSWKVITPNAPLPGHCQFVEIGKKEEE